MVSDSYWCNGAVTSVWCLTVTGVMVLVASVWCLTVTGVMVLVASVWCLTVTGVMVQLLVYGV